MIKISIIRYPKERDYDTTTSSNESVLRSFAEKPKNNVTQRVVPCTTNRPMCYTDREYYERMIMMFRELPTIRRFEEIGIKDLDFSNEDLRSMHYAFRKLLILKKTPLAGMTKEAKEIFERNKPEFQEKMRWVNEFMRSKGYPEDVFRDIDCFESCSDDYDYYYELKTPKQLEEEENERMCRKAHQ